MNEDDPRVIAGGKLQDAAMLINEAMILLWPRRVAVLREVWLRLYSVMNELDRELEEAQRELPS